MENLKTYSFKQLQDFLNDWDNRNKFLIVKNKEQNSTAVMHVFMENFCGEWKSGDGILFYNDGEAHSADDSDKFTLINTVSF